MNALTVRCMRSNNQENKDGIIKQDTFRFSSIYETLKNAQVITRVVA